MNQKTNNKQQITKNKQRKNMLSVICYLLSKRSGFTLLELLVVVSIMTILITMSISSFSTAQMKGRDAKRKSDMRDVSTSLEQYYSVCGYKYPTPSGTFYSPVTCTNPSIAILPTVPTDPRGATPYYCSGTCNSSTYTICSGLEAESPNTFCRTNQQ